MKHFLSLLLLALAMPLFSSHLSAQNDRSFIRDAITEYGECRNVAITEYNGDLMLYGRNGWAASCCPDGLTDKLDELNEEGAYINDVQLTEYGNWLILYGRNGLSWYGIPYSLENEIREYNNNQEEITSITFNDAGEWIVISTDHYSASHQYILDHMKEGSDLYGMIWAACITDDALVVVYENGFTFLGDVPYSLQESLTDAQIDVYRIKIAGSSWFYADKYGNYSYNM